MKWQNKWPAIRDRFEASGCLYGRAACELSPSLPQIINLSLSSALALWKALGDCIWRWTPALQRSPWGWGKRQSSAGVYRWTGKIAQGFVLTCSSYCEPTQTILFHPYKSLLCPFCFKHYGSAITTLDIYFISTITLICQVYFLCTAGVP